MEIEREAKVEINGMGTKTELNHDELTTVKIDEEFKDNPIAKFIFGYMLGERDLDSFMEKENNIIDYNLAKIRTILCKRYIHVLSFEELVKIEKEAKLIYKMITENKEYIEENGITYHLGKDVKEYIEKMLR